jgi:teichuronic acid biosynthesis glycosyltransferase TuaC
MRVLVVAEYYPRAEDPALGVWAHRQTLAARNAGADVRVLVFHRPLPPLITLRRLDLRGMRHAISQPRAAELDGLHVDYLRYLSPPRPWSYSSWGAWAAPVLRRALAKLRTTFPFELVHAHYAVPAGDAVRRAAAQTPLVVSVHGGDLYGAHAGAGTIRATLAHARLVLANSSGTARRCAAGGARTTRVIHLGADLPAHPSSPPWPPTLVTVGHLVARKRHADVLHALGLLRERHPDLKYVVVGDGPERDRLRALAATLGLEAMIEWRGALPHREAVAVSQAGSLFVLPSVEEAFGVAYVEAMGGGVPAIGCRGEDGPEEIAAAGGGIALVPPLNQRALAAQIDALLSDRAQLDALGQQARLTIERSFTWPQCGRETVAAYREVIGAEGSPRCP